jgi:hypothetical protein
MSNNEIVPVEYIEVVAKEGSSMLPSFEVTPAMMFSPIPIPQDWKDEGYQVNWQALRAKTPKHEKKYHPKGFAYVSVDYCKRRLNDAFGNGRWNFIPNPPKLGRIYTQLTRKGESKTYQEVMISGWLVAPGLAGPVLGIGSAPWALSESDSGDPRFQFSTATNSAISNALKNAARKLGIASDVGEDETVEAEMHAQKETCVTLFEQLVKLGRKDEAIKVVRRYAINALVGDTLRAEAIDDGDVEDLTTALVNLTVMT